MTIRIGSDGQRHAHTDELLGLKSEICSNEVEYGADHQSAAREQRNRSRHLEGDQGRPQPVDRAGVRIRPRTAAERVREPALPRREHGNARQRQGYGDRGAADAHQDEEIHGQRRWTARNCPSHVRLDERSESALAEREEGGSGSDRAAADQTDLRQQHAQDVGPTRTQADTYSDLSLPPQAPQ